MIKNKTKGTILATEYVLCRSLFSRMKGLMFARKPKALVMEFPHEQRIGIHMWFVFFAIDILWLDRRKKVVAMREKLKPWTLATPSKASKYVVEVPEGTIAKSRTKLMDYLLWH